MKKCPFCAEEIQDEAIKCKYCGEFLGKSVKQSHSEVVDYLEKKRRSDRGNAQGCGCLLMSVGLILAVLEPILGPILAIIGLVILIVGLIR